MLGETDSPSWRPSESFDFEGQRVGYDVIGEGEPVVLLHGTPFSSVVWRRIAAQLARGFRVYYFDLLGYGSSEKRQGQDVSLGVQNRLFAALLDHWGLDRPHVVGHDFGGATALRTHLLNERDYRSLTLIDPVAMSPHGSALVRTARRHEEAFAELPEYIHQAVLRAYIAGAVHRELSEREMDRYVEPWLGEQGRAAFYRQIAQMDDQYTDEIQDRYDEIRCPVTLLWGEHDAWIPLERGRVLANRIPNANFEVVAEAGHLVQEDAPEVVVAAVTDLLRRIG